MSSIVWVFVMLPEVLTLKYTKVEFDSFFYACHHDARYWKDFKEIVQYVWTGLVILRSEYCDNLYVMKFRVCWKVEDILNDLTTVSF